jgi:hypothetical protein
MIIRLWYKRLRCQYITSIASSTFSISLKSDFF